MKTVPNFRTFITNRLKDHIVLSDVDLMDMFARQYYTNTFWQVHNFWQLGKKLESMRKVMWKLRKDNYLRVERIIKTPLEMSNSKKLETHEIFYSLN